MNNIIIYGPSCTCKTTYMEALRKFYNKEKAIDEFRSNEDTTGIRNSLIIAETSFIRGLDLSDRTIAIKDAIKEAGL